MCIIIVILTQTAALFVYPTYQAVVCVKMTIIMHMLTKIILRYLL